MKIYIAGKIAGDRRYRAKFREAAKTLEAAGHVVLNPATLPDGLTDGDYMRIALATLVNLPPPPLFGSFPKNKSLRGK